MKNTATNASKITLSLILGASMFLLGGTTGAQTSVITSGPGSSANVSIFQNCDSQQINQTEVFIRNNNQQAVGSGNATASNNSNVDGVSSGGASAGSSTNVDLKVNNQTGPDCPAANEKPVDQPSSTPTPPPVANPESEVPGAVIAASAAGRGGEVLAQQQVQAPQGGVSAGVGGMRSFGVLLFGTLSSGFLAALRTRKWILGSRI